MLRPLLVAWWSLHADEELDESFHNIHHGHRPLRFSASVIIAILVLGAPFLHVLSWSPLHLAAAGYLWVGLVLCNRRSHPFVGRHRGYRDALLLFFFLFFLLPFSSWPPHLPPVPSLLRTSLFVAALHHKPGAAGNLAASKSVTSPPRGKPPPLWQVALLSLVPLAVSVPLETKLSWTALCAGVGAVAWLHRAEFYLHVHHYFLGALALLFVSQAAPAAGGLFLGLLVEGAARWSLAPIFMWRGLERTGG